MVQSNKQGGGARRWWLPLEAAAGCIQTPCGGNKKYICETHVFQTNPLFCCFSVSSRRTSWSDYSRVKCHTWQETSDICCPSSRRVHLLLLAALKQHGAVLTAKTTKQDCERQFGHFFPSVSCLVAVNKIVFSVWQWLIERAWQRAAILGADGASS